MRGLNEAQRHALAVALLSQVRETLPERAAEWTQFNDTDPGVTLLELFAFLAENVVNRTNGIPPRAALAAQRLADAANALVSGKTPSKECALERVNYFTGQLLTSADLQQEQDYLRSRFRRLTLALHGVGIVSGLHVSVECGAGSARQRVVVQPGLALDPHGEELVVCAPQLVTLPAAGTALFLQVRHAETPAAPVPQVTTGSAGEAQQFSRIREGVAIALASEVHADVLSIARLTFSRGSWRADLRFTPPRPRA